VPLSQESSNREPGISGIAAIVRSNERTPDQDRSGSLQSSSNASSPPQRNISISIDRIDLAPPEPPVEPRRRIEPRMSLDRYRERLK
jgi:hypothetical protein